MRTTAPGALIWSACETGSIATPNVFYSPAVARKKTGTARPKAKKTTGGQEERDAANRRDRIIDVAIRLAEEGGFENVRQRDVAKQSGVALGTLYKSFRSKEDILAAALSRETDALESKLERKPAKGDTAAERLGTLFSMLTRTILRKPNYARAVLRAMTSGEEVAQKVVAHQVKVTRMVIAAMRGMTPTAAFDERAPSENELQVAMLLQNLWFAALVGWSAKLHGQARVVEQMRTAATLLLKGADIEG
jgi:AcrR family transcriptional regulator